MMTKKFYSQLAEILKTVRYDYCKNSDSVSEAIDNLEKRLILYFTEDDPLFDRKEFQDASNLDE